MSAIRCIYSVEPNFPAIDQHPDAVRYQVGPYWVDAIGVEPMLAEVDSIVAPSQDVRAAAHVDGVDRLQFEHLFDLENRMRAQEGLAAITRTTYRQALIERWKQLNA